MYIPYSYYYSPSTSPSTTSYYYYFFEIPEEDLSKKSEIKVNVYGFIDIMKNIFNVFNSMSFPKYRLYVNDSKQEAIVEFGLAGYDKEDISVVCKPYEGSKEQKMIWISVKEHEQEHDGFALISSTLKYGKSSFGFVLPKYMEVTSAKYENGVLRIFMKMNVPDDLKDQQIKIE